MKTTLHKYLGALATLIAAGQISYAQQLPTAWVNRALPSNYENYDVQEVALGLDSIGNVYTAASVSDTANNLSKTMLVKYNAAGVQQWMKLYDAAGTYTGSQVVSLLVDKAGNSYVCGYGKHNASSDYDFMIIKYDNSGNQGWVQYWDGGANDADYITCAAFDVSGNILVGGYARTATYDDMAVLKLSTSGTIAWHYTYNYSPVNDEDRVKAIASDGLGNVFITGSSFNTKRDMITIKLNSAGSNQWTNRVAHVTSGTDERGYSIAADAAGNCYVTGAAGDWVTFKYSPAGSVLWTHHYTDNDLNSFTEKKLLIGRDGDIVLGGDAFVNSANQSDLVVEKLDHTNGAYLWNLSFNYGGVDNFTSMALDTSGSIYVSGYFDGALGTDMSAMIMTSQGSLTWNTVYSNTLHVAGSDRPYQIAVDNYRNVYIAGVSETRGSGSTDAVDVVTLKYGAVVTGIAEHNLSAALVRLYPNPASDQLTISVTDLQLLGAGIAIMDATGKTVKQETLTALNQQLSLSRLNKGIYFVKITGSRSVSTAKLVIE